MWYQLWFVGILLMCAITSLVLVWLEPRFESAKKDEAAGNHKIA